MGTIYRGDLSTTRGRINAWVDALLIDHVVFQLIWSNLAAVAPGRLYRCNHPTLARLEELTKELGLTTLIYLRGQAKNGSDAVPSASTRATATLLPRQRRRTSHIATIPATNAPTSTNQPAFRPAGRPADPAICMPGPSASCANEARIGQKNKITRRWARCGTRPVAPQGQRYASTDIFGAVRLQQGNGASVVLPRCTTDAMSLHLAEIATMVSPGRHAVLLLDQAGWHLSAALTVPPNITLLPMPSKCPELNVMENVWQVMRDNWLSNCVSATYDDIVAHCCDA